MLSREDKTQIEVIKIQLTGIFVNKALRRTYCSE